MFRGLPKRLGGLSIFGDKKNLLLFFQIVYTFAARV